MNESELRFKVCLLGAHAVGKTSLVRRFVESRFDERYQTTIGVKVDRKALDVGGRSVVLVLWDIAGEDAFHQVRDSYLRGAAGHLLVVDGTRPATLDVALELRDRAEAASAGAAVQLILNKGDLERQWALEPEQVEATGHEPIRTSARTGAGVEQAFRALAEGLVAGRTAPS